MKLEKQINGKEQSIQKQTYMYQETIDFTIKALAKFSGEKVFLINGTVITRYLYRGKNNFDPYFIPITKI